MHLTETLETALAPYLTEEGKRRRAELQKADPDSKDRERTEKIDYAEGMLRRLHKLLDQKSK